MSEEIVIVGGGFGGVYTAHHLLRKLRPSQANITLINDKNYFLFVPMIHEVATGNIRIHNVVEPIREILKGKNFRFCKDTVTKVDLEEKKVYTEQTELDYDYLVTAVGSETNFYGLEGKEELFTLKSLGDAYKIRNRVIDMFEEASMTDDEEELGKLLRFVVVGGGPTGTELSAELADWTKLFCKQYPDICMDDVELILVDPNEKVLRGVDEKLRDKAMKTLRRKGVRLEMGGMAKGVSDGELKADFDGDIREFESPTIIWTAGVKPRELEVKGAEKERGAIQVNPKLQVIGHPKAYAVGDVASYVNPETGEQPPPTAQLAVQQAKAAARNIVADVKGKGEQPFKYKSRGFLASLGNGQAVAKIGGIRFYGFLAWWTWRTIYLTKLLGLENKLRVMIDWTFDLFFPRDTSQV